MYTHSYAYLPADAHTIMIITKRLQQPQNIHMLMHKCTAIHTYMNALEASEVHSHAVSQTFCTLFGVLRAFV